MMYANTGQVRRLQGAGHMSFLKVPYLYLDHV